jgi:hypothetical protein
VILSGAFDQDLTVHREEEGELTVRLGFRRGSPARRAGGVLQRCFGEF